MNDLWGARSQRKNQPCQKWRLCERGKIEDLRTLSVVDRNHNPNLLNPGGGEGAERVPTRSDPRYIFACFGIITLTLISVNARTISFGHRNREKHAMERDIRFSLQSFILLMGVISAAFIGVIILAVYGAFSPLPKTVAKVDVPADQVVEQKPAVIQSAETPSHLKVETPKSDAEPIGVTLDQVLNAFKQDGKMPAMEFVDNAANGSEFACKVFDTLLEFDRDSKGQITEIHLMTVSDGSKVKERDTSRMIIGAQQLGSALSPELNDQLIEWMFNCCKKVGTKSEMRRGAFKITIENDDSLLGEKGSVIMVKFARNERARAK